MRWSSDWYFISALGVRAQLLQTPALPMVHALKVFRLVIFGRSKQEICASLALSNSRFCQVHFGIGRWHKKAGSGLENLVRWVCSEFCCFGTTTGNLAIQSMSYWYGVLSNYAVQLVILWKTMGSVLRSPCTNPPDSLCFVKVIGSHNSVRQSSQCEWRGQRKETCDTSAVN